MTETDPRSLWQAYVRRVGAMLALAGVIVFSYNAVVDNDYIEETALRRARAHFRDILLTWHWNSGYGGVYVERKEGVNATDFLEFPDIVSRDGKIYTMRDPDTMSREIASLARRKGDHRFHITSLRPKNPDNVPDAWEAKALRSFEAGRSEIFESVYEEGNFLFRYMAPMQTEKTCHTCHSEKLYKVGEVQGGVSVSFDITDEVMANRRHQVLTGLLILLTMCMVFFVTRWFTRRLDFRLSEINRGFKDLLAEKNAILQNAVVGIAFVRDERVVSCNRRFEDIFGVPQGGLNGKPLAHLYENVDVFNTIHRRAGLELASGRTFNEEAVLRKANGECFWGSVTGQAVDALDPEQGAIWIYADISSRREAMAEANKLRRAVEQSPISILITDRHGCIEYVNPRFSAITGYGRDEVIGRNPRLLNSGMMPREVFSELWSTLLAGREWRGELLNKRKDGQLLWEDVSISPMLAESGEISHFIAVKEDISARKAFEQAQEAHQIHLEELVQARTADLSRALAAAQSADHAKTEFLANISHEMRTPLNAVIGLSGLARQLARDPGLRDYLEKIGHAGHTLLSIINDLLDLSKIAAGRLELEQIPFSLSQLMSRVESLLAHRFSEHGLSFRREIDPALPAFLVGDSLRLEQILLNLLTNAIKFTERGGVVVRMRGTEQGDQQLCLEIEVEDTGIGMSATEIERLFQPFTQADSSITRMHGGTGLGLNICRRLAELMGGRIDVSSTPGEGSCFRVRLLFGLADAALIAAEQTQPEEIEQRIHYHDSRVLIVDDQPVNRQIVAELLRQVGVSSDEARNGQEAVDAIRAHPPGWFDLVFMDIQMPVMDGLSATRLIREQSAQAGLPIIAMTAHTMTHEREASITAGMNDHLGKPFEPDTFYRLLAAWIPAAHQDALPLSGDDGVPVDESVLPALPVLQGVDLKAGLARFGGNEAMYFGWLKRFDGEAATCLEQLLAEIGGGQLDAASRIAHGFKGRVGMLGMTALWEATATLETTLKAGQDTANEFEHFRLQLAETRQVLASANLEG